MSGPTPSQGEPPFGLGVMAPSTRSEMKVARHDRAKGLHRGRLFKKGASGAHEVALATSPPRFTEKGETQEQEKQEKNRQNQNNKTGIRVSKIRE